MSRSILRCTAVIAALFTGVFCSAQESLTVTQEDGTTISVGPSTLVEMEASDGSVETYILTPAVPSEMASVTILNPQRGKGSPEQRETKATGKKITIWIRSVEQKGEEGMDFRIEGEARLVQAADRMYGPKSIEFKQQKLTIVGSDGKEGELLYTFQDGRHVDWQGQEFCATFRVDQDGRYLLNSFKTPKPFTRLNFFHPSLKGGMGHLIPTARSSGAESGEVGRKVSPSK